MLLYIFPELLISIKFLLEEIKFFSFQFIIQKFIYNFVITLFSNNGDGSV